ncbi:MAG TPA: MarR family transcriptional regulator [Baekduia sp.]|nr:MarR family transcriptional regulator [Baekduia sp.]
MAVTDDTQLVSEWRELLERHARTNCALEHALKEYELGVSEFEVLEQLITGDKQEARVQRLAELVHLSQSALSRVVARLEADGLVSRGMCASDRRGVFVCVTPEGLERYEAAKPAQRAVLADFLG